MPAWLTLQDAAKVAGVVDSRLRQLIRDGKIPKRCLRREGPRWLISRSAVKKIRDTHPEQGWPRGKKRRKPAPKKRRKPKRPRRLSLVPCCRRCGWPAGAHR